MKYGKIHKAILLGTSMGGCVATLTGETYPEIFAGIVAVGAALLTKDDSPIEPHQFSYIPKVPTIFLTNESELGIISEYIRLAKVYYLIFSII
jgi:pimeloyl-ACP methyl ester carboxylesterase